MKNIYLFLVLMLLFTPAWTADKKTYVAKTKKNIKYKKKKYKVYIRKYPVRSNTSTSGENLKLQEMLKDIYE